MSIESVTVTRIYVSERDNLSEKIVQFLYDESKVDGVTLLRGVEGFSEDSPTYPPFKADFSVDLPLIIEFYDKPERVEATIQSLTRRFPLRHIVSWTATSYKF